MADVRIKDLPTNGAPSASQYVPTDLATTEKLTIQALVDTGAPLASQAEAEAGVQATKRMTPLTTKQAIAVQAATFAQGALADTAVQPGDLSAVATTGNYNDLSNQPSLSADLIYPVKADAVAATIPSVEHALRINGSVTVGDGLGGLYIDTNNGSADTFVSSGGTSRTWYRAPDVGAGRLFGAQAIRDFLVLPKFLDGNLGLSQTRRYIDGVLSGAVYDSSVAVLNGDAPNFFIYRAVKHTVAASGVPRAFGVLTQVLSDGKNYEFAGESALEDKAAQTVAVDFVGFKSSYARFASAAGTLASGWGGYDELHDLTLLRSSLSGGVLRGREITMIASGLDDANRRFGLDVVHSKSPGYGGTDTQFAVGIRVINAGFYGNSFGRSIIGTAFDAHGDDPFGNGSTILTGFRANVTNYGVLINGSPVSGAFVAEVAGQAIVSIGSVDQTTYSAAINIRSPNAGGALKTTASIDGGITTQTVGAEVGRLGINVAIAGTLTEAMVFLPQVDPLNPAYLRLDGGLHPVKRKLFSTVVAGDYVMVAA